MGILFKSSLRFNKPSFFKKPFTIFNIWIHFANASSMQIKYLLIWHKTILKYGKKTSRMFAGKSEVTFIISNDHWDKRLTAIIVSLQLNFCLIYSKSVDWFGYFGFVSHRDILKLKCKETNANKIVHTFLI